MEEAEASVRVSGVIRTLFLLFQPPSDKESHCLATFLDHELSTFSPQTSPLMSNECTMSGHLLLCELPIWRGEGFPQKTDHLPLGLTCLALNHIDCCVFCLQRWSCCLHRVDWLRGLLRLKIELSSSQNGLTVEFSVLEDRAIVFPEWTHCVIFCAWRWIYRLHRVNRLWLKTEGASGLYKLNTLYEVNIQKALSLPDYFITPNLIQNLPQGWNPPGPDQCFVKDKHEKCKEYGP